MIIKRLINDASKLDKFFFFFFGKSIRRLWKNEEDKLEEEIKEIKNEVRHLLKL